MAADQDARDKLTSLVLQSPLAQSVAKLMDSVGSVIDLQLPLLKAAGGFFGADGGAAATAAVAGLPTLGSALGSDLFKGEGALKRASAFRDAVRALGGN